jgi:hypothetical protein
MTYNVSTILKSEILNELYDDYVKCKADINYDISNFYTIILVDYMDNKKKVFHIECIEELEFFIKNFTHRDVIYIMKSPWRNSNNIDSRYDIDCINGIIYNEYLEEFNGNRFKYFNAICKEFGVENYGEENNPWQGRY